MPFLLFTIQLHVCDYFIADLESLYMISCQMHLKMRLIFSVNFLFSILKKDHLLKSVFHIHLCQSTSQIS